MQNNKYLVYTSSIQYICMQNESRIVTTSDPYCTTVVLAPPERGLLPQYDMIVLLYSVSY